MSWLIGFGAKAMKVYVIGAGPGRIDLLSGYAAKVLAEVDLVITTDRLYENFKALNGNSVACPLGKIAEQIAVHKKANSIAVLVSGDVGFYSFSDTVKKNLTDCELIFINGFSSLQYLAAKLQIPYDQVKTVSVHGREKSAIPYVCYHENVFVLTGGKYKAHDVIEELVLAGLDGVTITVGENLADAAERVITDTARNLQGINFANLAVMLIQNKNYVNSLLVLQDDDFIRAKAPMTKAEVRNLSLDTLNVLPGDVVYDIGAGTGSVAIGMARRACENFVYAIEKEADAVALLQQNREKLGAFNLKVIHAAAPDGLLDLPDPDKVFVGGSSGNLAAIFAAVMAKNSGARIVVNAITLETLQEAVACFESWGVNPNVVCVNIAKAEKIGRYRLMKAQNPVYIISGEQDE